MREMALAGPVTVSRLETNIAATMHGTRAEYRPHCGGCNPLRQYDNCAGQIGEGIGASCALARAYASHINPNSCFDSNFPRK